MPGPLRLIETYPDKLSRWQRIYRRATTQGRPYGKTGVTAMTVPLREARMFVQLPVYPASGSAARRASICSLVVAQLVQKRTTLCVSS